MTQVIEKTQTDAYIDIVAKYPDIKIRQRTFDKLKPFFVRPASEPDLFPVGWEIPGDNQKAYTSLFVSSEIASILVLRKVRFQAEDSFFNIKTIKRGSYCYEHRDCIKWRKSWKNLGVKCNFANNWVFRPGEFQAENESELKY
jgi:hypothetical protein